MVIFSGDAYTLKRLFEHMLCKL